MMAFNHYLVIPEGFKCYVDTYSYGRFDAFLSVSSVLNVTMETSVYQDGVCLIDQTGVPLESGSLTGDVYCQIYLEVEMGDCDGCPDYQRRLEVYSNSKVGCPVDEFVSAVEETVEETTDDTNTTEEPEDTNPEETNEENDNDNGSNDGGSTTEDNEDGSIFLSAGSAFASTLAILMIPY